MFADHDVVSLRVSIFTPTYFLCTVRGAQVSAAGGTGSCFTTGGGGRSSSVSSLAGGRASSSDERAAAAISAADTGGPRGGARAGGRASSSVSDSAGAGVGWLTRATSDPAGETSSPVSLSEMSLSDEAGELARRTGAPSGEKSSSVSLSDEEDEVLSFPAIICVICLRVGVSAYSGRRLEDGR